MSGNNLLNNDNKTNYLFKKDNLRAQTALEVPDITTSGRSLAQELYLANKTIVNNNILAQDICFNLPTIATVIELDNNDNIPDSTWGINSTDTVVEQELSYYDLSNVDPSLANLRFYKKVFLEPIKFGEKQFWWLQFPSRNPNDVGKISNNLLSNTIPSALGKNGTDYLPRIHLWNQQSNEWLPEIFNQAPTSTKNNTNWTMDFATGILTFNVTDSTLTNGTGSSLNAAESEKTNPESRPRISFIKYVGPLGVNGGSGGGGGGGGGVSDISFDQLNQIISDLDETIYEYLFDIPGYLQDVSWNDEIVSGNKYINISWNNPPQKCAAFDFYQLNIINNSNIIDTDQIYYTADNGLQESDTKIYNEITRKLNKLPFHEYIRIQYKEFDSNSNVIRDWTDLTGAQINSISNLKLENSSGVLYPFFKEINKVVIFNDAPNNPSELNGKSTQDILPKQDGKREIILNNIFESSSKFHFRLAMDNRACIDGKSGKERTPLDISNNLNWSYIPENPLDFIELGDFGPAPPPSSIQFSGNSSPFGFDFIEGEAGPFPEPVMDTSFNTEFTSTAPLTVQYGFDLSGSPVTGRKQIGEDFISSLSSFPFAGSEQDYYYANTNSFGFYDVSYNTGETREASFTAVIWETPSDNWNVSNQFQNNFKYDGAPWEGLLLPEYQYDISGFFMKNSKHPQISYLEKSVYDSNLPEYSDYPTLERTADEIEGNDAEYKQITGQNFTVTNTNDIVINITDPIRESNTDITTVLVRRGDNHDESNVIFLNESNTTTTPSIPESILKITFKNDIVTSTQDYDPDDDVLNDELLVGSDIWDRNIGNYELEHEFYNISNTLTNYNISANITGFKVETINNSSSTLPTSNIEVENDDPTGKVGSTASITQARFGGYYNIQTITGRNTGVSDIMASNISDSADNNYDHNTIILTQTLKLPTPNILNTKTIEYLIGFASQKDINPLPNTLDIPLITTDNYLFGIQMPSENVTFQLSNVVIDDIYTKWIPNNKNLCYINLYYRRSSSDKYTIKTDERDWLNPVKNQQIISFGSSNPFHEEWFNNSDEHFIKDSPDWYSRNGLEGSDNNSQFYIEIKTTNNIFSQESNDVEFIETLNSNSTTGVGFYWISSSEKILWWDYTYKQGAGAISAGELPTRFVTTATPSHSTADVYLKDSRGAGSTSVSGSTRFWLGGGTTLPGSHEWYDYDYDHQHNSTSNPPTLQNNQLLWANGSFRAGNATGSNNPYIDYKKYYNNNNSSNDYTSFNNLGESWNYTITSGVSSIGTTLTINGIYKFIVIEDQNASLLNGQGYSGVEFYVNGNSFSDTDKLELGKDYIMYICLEGDRYNNFNLSGVKSFTDNNGNTKYRTGWLDCQRQNETTKVSDGTGCGICRDNNVVTSYKFSLAGLASASPLVGTVNKIFFRIGIKNSSGKDISSIYIKYVK